MIRFDGNFSVVVIAVAGVSMFAGCAQRAPANIDPQMAYIDARSTMRQAADDVDPIVRANAIEAIAQTLGAKGGAVFRQGLDDSYPAVRFAAAMAVGDIRYAPARDLLLRMIRTKGEDARAEPDKRVFCAVVYALHRLGETGATAELGKLLFDPEKEVRSNAAMVMGKIGEPSAIEALRTQLAHEQEQTVQLQIVEAMATLGDSRSIILLESYTKTQFLEDRLVAISGMERIRSPASVPTLENLISEKQPPRVRVAAAGALAKLGKTNPMGHRICIQAAKDPHLVFRQSPAVETEVTDVEIFSLQRLAAISLGWMKDSSSVNVLHPLLNSADGGVRIAAAMSILRLCEGRVFRLTPEFPQEPFTEPSMGPSGAPAARATSEDAKTNKSNLYTAGGKD
ncbi:MAG: HEAT repeat domain-containing protein [Planctomycetota bacterium]|jgi:HEAT repeat protein